MEKPPITPILSKGAGYRILLDLIDMRSQADGPVNWIAHWKCAFSRKTWLDDLENKEAMTLKGSLARWLRANSRGSVYRM